MQPSRFRKDGRLCPAPDGQLRGFAPAKINLNLLVGPAGSDGFHPLDSYVVLLDFGDELVFSPRDDDRIELNVAGEIDPGPAEENLVLRAARALKPYARCGQGATISLTKRIPCGAGLGGGSSDAATALLALRVLWGLDLGRSRLSEIALDLGSDVPLFLAEGPWRMRGRGEILEPVAVRPSQVLLILSGLHCPTGAVYRAFDQLPHEPHEQIPARELSGPVANWRARLVNDLLAPACRVQTDLERVYREALGVCPVPVCLTGSGSALFALFDNAETLDQAREGLSRIQGIQTLSTGMIGR